MNSCPFHPIARRSTWATTMATSRWQGGTWPGRPIQACERVCSPRLSTTGSITGTTGMTSTREDRCMIPMNDFRAEPQEMREAMLGAARRVLVSGWYVLGSEVSKFESRWAATCGVARGVGVANGMDAIEIALRALGIGPGDEVITTPMTAFATVLAIYRAGAVPVLADIEPESGLLSLESAGRCLSARTRAVVLVHLYGQLRNIDQWQSFCAGHGIQLVEDCAQAHLASRHGKLAGSFGVAGAYSFYPTKNLGAPGDAGMLVTNDPGIADRAAILRNYGQSMRYHHPVLGLNSRLDEL